LRAAPLHDFAAEAGLGFRDSRARQLAGAVGRWLDAKHALGADEHTGSAEHVPAAAAVVVGLGRGGRCAQRGQPQHDGQTRQTSVSHIRTLFPRCPWPFRTLNRSMNIKARLPMIGNQGNRPERSRTARHLLRQCGNVVVAAADRQVISVEPVRAARWRTSATISMLIPVTA
jgi:hypothetical protein